MKKTVNIILNAAITVLSLIGAWLYLNFASPKWVAGAIKSIVVFHGAGEMIYLIIVICVIFAFSLGLLLLNFKSKAKKGIIISLVAQAVVSLLWLAVGIEFFGNIFILIALIVYISLAVYSVINIKNSKSLE